MIISVFLLSLYSPSLLPVQPNQQVVVQLDSADKQNQRQQLSVSEAIKLAKQAALLMKYPPRIYEQGGENVQAWLDKPGSVQIYYNTCGATPPIRTNVKCQAPMTLKVVVKPNRSKGGYNVKFESLWNSSGSLRQHSWQFDVGVDRKVTFGSVEGANLPPMPM